MFQYNPYLQHIPFSLLLTRFQVTVPSPTRSCSSLETTPAPDSGSRHFLVSSFTNPHSPELWSIRFHICSHYYPTESEPWLMFPCSFITGTPQSSPFFVKSLLDSRVCCGLQSLLCRSWVFISPFLHLFLCLGSILFVLPSLFSCMVFGVCVETFIFQQLTLSYGNFCGLAVEGLQVL